MSTSSERGRGRPQAGQREGLDPRDTLIEIAAERFARQGFEGTSLRQVAEGADVTPAMVAYYFRDKSGLLEAVVRKGLEVMLGVVRTCVADHEPGTFVATLIQGYMATLVREPWIPQILIREVVSKDSPLRQVFIEEFAAHAADLVPATVAAEIRAGVLRADLDPRYAILSLVGMCLFPFIAHPVMGQVLGYQLDGAFAERYGRHVQELFLHGAGGSPR